MRSPFSAGVREGNIIYSTVHSKIGTGSLCFPGSGSSGVRFGDSREPPEWNITNRVVLLFYCHITSLLIRPIPPLLEPFHNVHQRNQNWHLDQRPYCAGQRLSATDTVHGNDNRNRQLEIVARGREALRTGDFVAEPEAAAQHHGDGEDNREVNDQRRTHAKNRSNLLDDVSTLGGKEDDDGEDEADQRPGRDEADEVKLVLALPQQRAQTQPCDHGRREWDPQEDGHALSDQSITHDCRVLVTDDSDVKQRERGEQHDLQDRVERHQDGAIVAVSLGEVGPDEHHGYTPCYADEDESFAEIGPVGQEGPRESAHE